MVDLDPKYEETARDDVVCWFNIPVGTKRSISLDDWVADCEKMGLDWEIRQSDDTHWTVFLMLKRGWLYNKQVRSFSTIQRQHSMTTEEVMKELIDPQRETKDWVGKVMDSHGLDSRTTWGRLQV
jgi:hypothetical protein